LSQACCGNRSENEEKENGIFKMPHDAVLKSVVKSAVEKVWLPISCDNSNNSDSRRGQVLLRSADDL
jgi:hypothetical protein